MPHKLLLVDDDKDTVEVLQKRLQNEGYSVVVAFDGQEALIKIKEENPDIILLDLMLPKRNGFEVLRVVREKYKDKWRPIIIISAKTELASLKECYDLEADYYLTKPCTMENILQGVKTMVSLIPLRIGR